MNWDRQSRERRMGIDKQDMSFGKALIITVFLLAFIAFVFTRGM